MMILDNLSLYCLCISVELVFLMHCFMGWQQWLTLINTDQHSWMKNLSVTVLGIKGIHTCKVLRVMPCTELIFNKYYRDVNSQDIL